MAAAARDRLSRSGLSPAQKAIPERSLVVDDTAVLLFEAATEAAQVSAEAAICLAWRPVSGALDEMYTAINIGNVRPRLKEALRLQ
jgi:hypothetical protein